MSLGLFEVFGVLTVLFLVLMLCTGNAKWSANFFLAFLLFMVVTLISIGCHFLGYVFHHLYFVVKL
jgi:hypothetical protein